MEPKRVGGAAETTAPPSESTMAAVLGDAYAAFQRLVRGNGEAVAEWRRYSKNSPWLLKVSKGKRTLFYARPDGEVLKITVLLGGRAVEAALAGKVSKKLQASIREAKVFPEGRPVSVWIKKATDIAKVEELISLKLEATGRPGKPPSRPKAGRRRT